MRHAPEVARWVMVLCLAVSASCATVPATASEEARAEVEARPVRVMPLAGGELRLDFESLPPEPTVLEVEEARWLLAAFQESFREPRFEVIPAMSKPRGSAAGWERRLREEFVSRYGPPRLPVPESIERSGLFMALRLSPRFMGPGFRDAAEELFRSPVFLASVAFSVLVYFAAWLMPEPFFSKAFAAALTARLALAVGLLEVRNTALACLRLYREVQAARSVRELEAVAERFGRALGGTGLRVLVTVASFGVARGLPDVPSGGPWGVAGSAPVRRRGRTHVSTCCDGARGGGRLTHHRRGGGGDGGLRGGQRLRGWFGAEGGLPVAPSGDGQERGLSDAGWAVDSSLRGFLRQGRDAPG
ncbi:hypothetical protein P2318_02270 [Myxococcaceae bacterium GXIMD 01537]